MWYVQLYTFIMVESHIHVKMKQRSPSIIMNAKFGAKDLSMYFQIRVIYTIHFFV